MDLWKYIAPYNTNRNYVYADNDDTNEDAYRCIDGMIIPGWWICWIFFGYCWICWMIRPGYNMI